MRKLVRLYMAPAALIAALAASAIVLQSQSISAEPMPPMLTASELARFQIAEVQDVTGNPSAVSPTPPITYAQAVDIAAKKLGRPATNVRVLHGSAKAIHDMPTQPVWIVMFTGGTVPALGPKNSFTPRPLRFAAVMIDDATGDVMTWFMT